VLLPLTSGWPRNNSNLTGEILLTESIFFFFFLILWDRLCEEDSVRLVFLGVNLLSREGNNQEGFRMLSAETKRKAAEMHRDPSWGPPAQPSLEYRLTSSRYLALWAYRPMGKEH
jgi:hypothetical protein